MIRDNNRIIVVFGMAHSGTTIFAKTLAQCPLITPMMNGNEAWIFENAQLGSRTADDASFIEKALNHLPKDQYLMLKKPWAELDPGFFREQMPDATYYCFLKSFLDSKESWSKSNSFVWSSLRTDAAEQSSLYWKHLSYAWRFPIEAGARRYRMIEYTYFATNPEVVLESVCSDLNINFRFDTTEISPYGDVKSTLREMLTTKKVSMARSHTEPKDLKKRFSQRSRDRLHQSAGIRTISVTVHPGVVLMWSSSNRPAPFSAIHAKNLKFSIQSSGTTRSLSTSTLNGPSSIFTILRSQKNKMTKQVVLNMDTLKISSSAKNVSPKTVVLPRAQVIASRINGYDQIRIYKSTWKKLLDWLKSIWV